MNAVLRVSGLERRFGGLRAVDQISFDVHAGEVFGIIGPNGAGKTTLFNVITGALPATAGSVSFGGRDIGGATLDEVARYGIIRTFQSTTVFKAATVAENVRRGFLFGQLSNPSKHIAPAHLASARKRASKKAVEVLGFTNLDGVADVSAGDLPYGLQKVVGVAMALAAEPRLMLMDEPAAGLNPTETTQMGRMILKLRDELGIDVVLVEHDMKMIMTICDRILVLNHGKAIAIGTPEEIQSDQSVIDAYLGADYDFSRAALR